MSERIIKWFAEAYCKGHNLILININDDGYKKGKWHYIMDCIDDENKFCKYEITDKWKSNNGILYSELKAIRI